MADPVALADETATPIEDGGDVEMGGASAGAAEVADSALPGDVTDVPARIPFLE